MNIFVMQDKGFHIDLVLYVNCKVDRCVIFQTSTFEVKGTS